MTDMDAFDRLIASEVVHASAPSRPVDDAAIFTTITTAQSRKWSFQSMFSATKFVVAGAIVALFGGFLLAGVLTQPNDESVPAVGASASATAQVESTVQATAEPEPVPERDETDQFNSTTPAGTFSSVASLAGAPIGTATLLQDGRVLIVGDARAEVWDPATGTLSPAGELDQPRPYHRTALLVDGRVLIVGGNYEYGEMPTAEVWDPETESFSPAGSFSEWHSEHRPAVTLLPDGRVLVMGGGSHHSDGTRVAEVWDPETATFRVVGEMAESRANPTATLLGNGRVLVVGGELEGGGTEARAAGLSPLATTEVWDPETESFNPSGQLLEARGAHAAALLHDGRVLIIGGGDTYDYETSAAEIWDPATGTFAPAGSLTEARAGHTATLLPDGRVLVIGGVDIGGADGDDVTAAEVWDPDTATFSPAGSLLGPRSQHSATLLSDGRVLVVGGPDRGSPAEVWEPTGWRPPSDDPLAATSDLLPSVDLVTEEVEPGVYRVLDDGAGHDLQDGISAMATEDSVWVETRRVFELGRPGTYPSTRSGFLVASDDGTLWAATGDGRSLRSFDGEAWTNHDDYSDADGSSSDPWWPPDYISDFAVHPDGTFWRIAANEGDDAHTRLQRLGRDGWMTYRVGEGLPTLGCSGACGGGWSIEITPDGSVWLGLDDGGLLRFDGTDWEIVRPLGGDVDHGVIGLAANRDGVLWAEIWVGDGPPSPRTDLREERRLARFDGQAWEVFSWAPAVPGITAVGPDGAVWLTDFYSDQDDDGRLGGPDLSEVRFKHLPVSFDGERWRRYPALLMDVASDPQNQAVDYVLGASVMAVGPDGAVWVRGDAFGGTGGLYVITPEAVAATE